MSTQATAELSAWRRMPEQFADTEVTVQPLSLHFGGARLWRAAIPIDHFHPYLIAERKGALYRLGGFAASDLVELAQESGMKVRGQSDAVALARLMGTLLDPNGGEAVLIAQVDTSPVADQWKRLRPGNWPMDTVVNMTAGQMMVRVTALSQSVHSYDQACTPFVYTFVFAGGGVLSEWAQRAGTPFQGP